MRIGLIFPASWTPRRNGTEGWGGLAAVFVRGLRERGIETSVFNAGRPDGNTHPHFQSEPSKDRRHSGAFIASDCLNVRGALERAEEFDVLHAHDSLLVAAYSRFVKTPVVSTVYAPPPADALSMCRECGDRCVHVTASDAGRRPGLQYLCTVYPGIDVTAYEYGSGAGGYLLWPDAISAGGGIEEAVEVARGVGRKLVVTGRVEDKVYFHDKIAPHVERGLVRLMRPVSGKDLEMIRGEAVAVLHSGRDDAFPLHLLESGACGTPVIALDGAVAREIVSHGVNGVSVNNADEAIEEAQRIGSWDRRGCRRFVERRYGCERMVEDYAILYRTLLEKSKPHALISRPPWGLWTVLEDEPSYKVKRVEVLPGKRLSYQKHYKRSEHWMVVRGEALVTLDGKEIRLKEGQYIDIPPECAHRIENRGTKTMVFIEVQKGSYFGEDDIIRLEDDYGRKGTTN